MAADANRAKEIFLAAIEQPGPDRERFVQNAAGSNAELIARVRALLKAHDEPVSYLDEAMLGTNIVSPDELEEAETAGAIIGPYKLLEKIGEGGMGVVYMADQQSPVRRRVALKIIKPGMDSKQVIARFEAERQALALMDHPHIARVLDAGTTNAGKPYFVMELVRGIPITEYCDQNNLAVRERLELFVPVCHAVQHAHQKGIIHRDLKPSNVLVTLHDGKPVPKVIDFGVAKAMSQQLTEKTLFTQFAQMVGTPLYMSPEQAEMSGLDVDTRSDIYSLGVLLYELLTGTTPFDKHRMRKVAMEEMRRIIREEEPPRPSTRISTLGETRTSIAAHRKSDPDRLGQLVRGDLDWIVMKAIEKDRTHRYETANGFARDVQRFLTDQPIEARPPTAAYRFRKFARRNRLALTTASLVSGALVVGVVISTWQAVRATRAERAAARALHSEAEQRKVAETARDAEAVERRNAEEQRAEAERQRKVAETEAATAKQISDFLIGLFEPEGGNWILWQLGAVENKGSTLTAREILDRGAKRVLRNLESQPDVQTRLMDTIGYIYRNLGQLKEAEPLLDEALKRRTQALGVDHPDVAQSFEHIAGLRYDQDNVEEAIRLHREALAVRRKQFGENHLAVADSLASLGFLTTQQGNKAEAEQWFREALAIREKLLPPGHPDIGVCLWGIGFALSRQAWPLSGTERTQKLEDARSLNARARDIFSKIDGGENLGIVACAFLDSQLDGYTDNLPQATVRIVEAIALAKRMVGEHHPLIAILMREHIYVLEVMQRPKEAAEVRTELLKVVEVTYGPDHPLIGEVIATVGRHSSSSDETTEQIEAVLELLQQRLKLEQPKWESSKDNEQAWIELRPDKLAGLHDEIGKLLLRTNRIAESEEQFREALNLRRLIAQKRNTTIAIASFQDYQLLAKSKLAGRDYTGALAAFHQADEIVDQRLESGPKDRKYFELDVANGSEVMQMLASQARALFAEQKVDEGLALVDAEVQRRRDHVKLHPTGGRQRVKLSHALLISGDLRSEGEKPDETERDYRESLEISQKLTAEFPDDFYFQQQAGIASMKLGALLRDRQRFDDAKQYFRAALKAYGAALPGSPEYAEMRRRLSDAYLELAAISLTQGRHAETYELMESATREITDDWEFLSRAADVLSQCAAAAPNDTSLPKEKCAEAAALYARRSTELTKQVGSLAPDHSVLNGIAWNLAMQRKEPQRAIRLSKRANELSPNNTNYINTLGVACYRAGDWRSAEEALLRSCELPGAWGFFGSNAYFLAMTRWQLGEQEASRQWFRSAVLWTRLYAPSNRECRDFESEAATLLGQPDVSDLPQGESIDNIAITDPLLKLPLNLPWVHDVRAGTFIDRNDWKLAAFEARQMLTPESTFAQLYPLALIELAAHNLNEYRETCSKLLSLSMDNDPVNLHIIAWACILNSESVADWQPVTAIAERAVEVNPNDVATHLTLGAVKYRVGEFDAAINCIQTAEKLFVEEQANIRMSPAYGWYFLAMVHQKQGNSTEAGQWMSKANAETDRALTESIPWNRRATLNLLREEAQTVLGETSK